jgi:hypothetical protein
VGHRSCSCGTDAAGAAFCFANFACSEGVACTANSGCPTGSRCLAQGCCTTNVCVIEAPAGCQNTLLPRAIFKRGRVPNAAARRGLSPEELSIRKRAGCNSVAGNCLD